MPLVIVIIIINICCCYLSNFIHENKKKNDINIKRQKAVKLRN